MGAESVIEAWLARFKRRRESGVLVAQEAQPDRAATRWGRHWLLKRFATSVGRCCGMWCFASAEDRVRSIWWRGHRPPLWSSR